MSSECHCMTRSLLLIHQDHKESSETTSGPSEVGLSEVTFVTQASLQGPCIMECLSGPFFLQMFACLTLNFHRCLWSCCLERFNLIIHMNCHACATLSHPRFFFFLWPSLPEPSPFPTSPPTSVFVFCFFFFNDPLCLIKMACISTSVGQLASEI